MGKEIVRSFGDEIVPLICSDGHKFWVRTLCGSNRIIADQVTKICPYCGLESRQMTDEEWIEFISIWEE